MATVVRIGARVVVLWAVVVLSAACGSSVAGAALPDGRGYELVSPPDKNGAEVIPQTYKTHVRPDGDAVTFSSLGGFGGLEGSTVDFEYLARRTGMAGTSGWVTHGLNPLGRPVTFPALLDGNRATFVDGFSSDLSTAIYSAWRPLTDAPNVGDVSNLYRLTGLDGGSRTVQLLSDAVSPLPDMWFTDFRGQFARQILPQFAGVSSDLRHVVFESGLDLTADAPPYVDFLCVLAGLSCPPKLYENVDGVLRLVGRIPSDPAPDAVCDDEVGPACVAADTSQAALSATNKYYSQLAVSRDGRRIYFSAPGGLYLREDGVRTERITDDGGFWTASTDGSRMFFTSAANLRPDQEGAENGQPDDIGQTDLYMYDRDAPLASRMTQISIGANPGNANAVFGASDDGHTVYFTYSGQLIDGEPDAFQGLFRWHDGQLRYIGSFQSTLEGIANGSQTTWDLVSKATRSRIAPDGRHLLFVNTDAAGFVGRGGFEGYDHAGHAEFYVYDADSGRLACASCNPSGRAATTNALITVRDAASASAPTSDSSLALTDDGRRVFFSSAEALVPQDLNGRPDAYEYDTQTGTVHLLSSGKSTSPSYVIDSSPDGDDVYFVTRERLVGWDVDDAYDLYDARVGGGLPDPVRPSPGCTGEGCHGQSVPTPSADAFANPTSRGSGNAAGKLRGNARCGRKAALREARRKGSKAKGKHRCVKRRARRHAKRAASRSERSGR